MQPKLLVLDEPTQKLAPVVLEQLSKALETLWQTTDIVVLLGEQNVTFALRHADRVYVIEHARIVWEGAPARFAEDARVGYLQDRSPESCAFGVYRAVAMTAVPCRFPSCWGYPDPDLEPQTNAYEETNADEAGGPGELLSKQVLP
jgi:energy-coupling factor transporter ATP-binding protein EcfA2